MFWLLKGLTDQYPRFDRHYKRWFTSALSVGIRREGKNRWECRVPLAPVHVEKLIKETGCRVLVEPCTKRIFPDKDFERAGAILTQDLGQADIILGVKEVPVSKLLPGKTYLFFSHTHKGQRYNMVMLNEILLRKIRLIDYELMTDERKHRLVLFGTFAGYAGMINCLHGLGDRLLALGYHTPFLNLGLAHHFMSLDHAKKSISEVGLHIGKWGTPRALGPLVFVFTGNGNVSKGAQEMFSLLPHTFVKPEDLPNLIKDKDFDAHKVYGCVVTAADYTKRNSGDFDFKDFVSNPENYSSVFHETIAPYTSVIVNGIYWDARFPRLLTTAQIAQLQSQNRLRLVAISDISCDISGSLEFMDRASTIDQPFFFYDPQNKNVHYRPDGPGIQIMSIDNLPAQLPVEASKYFGNALYPFVKELVKANYTHPVVEGATITVNGELVKRHLDLKMSIQSVLKSSMTRNILVLGSGMVSGPLVDYLAAFANYNVTVASNNVQEAMSIANNRPNVIPKLLDIKDETQLSKLIDQNDIVVSFIPATLHAGVAKACIELKTDLVTASYVSPQIAELDEAAKRANIVIFKEIGLDPGIDHLTAMRIIHDSKRSGYSIQGFTSWCGGLPAPENSDNPLGYKFSWSPKGVLLAALNNAKYREDGVIHNIPGQDLLKSARDVPIYAGFNFEGLPNRDSLKYEKLYGLEGIPTMFRGTLRYKGFSNLMSQFKSIGLLDPSPTASFQISKDISWNAFLMKLLEAKNEKQLMDAIHARLGNEVTNSSKKVFFDTLKWLGILGNDTKIGTAFESPLDAICSAMSHKMVYKRGERDLVCLHHIFEMKHGKTGRMERRTSTLVAYGQPLGNGYTAMAKTVGLPAAIATRLILEGEIKDKGVVIPITREIYEPILKLLEKEGIHFEEKQQ